MEASASWRISPAARRTSTPLTENFISCHPHAITSHAGCGRTPADTRCACPGPSAIGSVMSIRGSPVFAQRARACTDISTHTPRLPASAGTGARPGTLRMPYTMIGGAAASHRHVFMEPPHYQIRVRGGRSELRRATGRQADDVIGRGCEGPPPGCVSYKGARANANCSAAQRPITEVEVRERYLARARGSTRGARLQMGQERRLCCCLRGQGRAAHSRATFAAGSLT
ncbi:hypothetical protein BV25DRAFT_1544629 [Artomyces pyxidatus]|uniref:Uncharacterized protein n=1 Tax=Artomyces pyxidatus TaxID=48021 RepID=A0ACB8SKH6_9AGAM|nr:hypothetical protein BV25DRAFT_1544629 [Artomyces pyxidatus]